MELIVRAGTIGWIDLTVSDCPAVRDFYKAVVGWEPSPVTMGDYDDYSMLAPGGGEPVAGILSRARRECRHAGAVADLHQRGGRT